MTAPRTVKRTGPQWLSLSDAVNRLVQQLGSAEQAQAELDKRIRWGEVRVRAGHMVNRSQVSYGTRKIKWTTEIRLYRNEPLRAEDWPRIKVHWAKDKGTISEQGLEVEISDLHISLADFARMFPPRVVHEMPEVTTYETGAPGRPSSEHLWKPEFQRRDVAGECWGSRSDEAEHLAAWLKSKHPNASSVTAKTIYNKLPAGWPRPNSQK